MLLTPFAHAAAIGFDQLGLNQDKQPLREAKRLLTEHSDQPLSTSINESHKAFFGALAWPETVQTV